MTCGGDDNKQGATVEKIGLTRKRVKVSLAPADEETHCIKRGGAYVWHPCESE
jgi:hypothetical protein